MTKTRWCKAARQAGSGVIVLVCALAVGCGKKEAPAEQVTAGERPARVAGQEETARSYAAAVAVRPAAVEEKSGEEVKAVEESAVPSGGEPAVEFLPPGFTSWKEFDETYARFRAERVAAQESLPVNEDGSRVWLGQIVFADAGLDARIKTFGMARQLVKSGAECVFMKMDGRRVKFSEPGLGEAIGKIAAKKYVKVFGWLDEQAGTIKPRYIDVAGEKYVWKDGELVRE